MEKNIYKTVGSCRDLDMLMKGTSEGIFSYNEQFRNDFEHTLFLIYHYKEEIRFLKQEIERLKKEK